MAKINIFALACLLNVVLVLRGTQCLVINDIDVPPVFLIDNVDDDKPINLDCLYDLEDDGKIILLKWLKDNQPVYQWIHGQNPSVFPQFKDDVDELFVMSTDSNQAYRGLSLINPTTDTTGTYRCVVQTSSETRFMEKRLQVIDISNYTLDLNFHKIQNETHLECTVDNVFPEPQISLSADDDDLVTIISTNINLQDNGLYNATTVAVVNDDDDDDDAFKCTVTFMGASLNLTETVKSAGSIGRSWAPVMLLLLWPLVYVAQRE